MGHPGSTGLGMLFDTCSTGFVAALLHSFLGFSLLNVTSHGTKTGTNPRFFHNYTLLSQELSTRIVLNKFEIVLNTKFKKRLYQFTRTISYTRLHRLSVIVLSGRSVSQCRKCNLCRCATIEHFISHYRCTLLVINPHDLALKSSGVSSNFFPDEIITLGLFTVSENE